MAGSAITELGTLVSLGNTEYQNSRGQVAVLKITAKMDEISVTGREAQMATTGFDLHGFILIVKKDLGSQLPYFLVYITKIFKK